MIVVIFCILFTHSLLPEWNPKVVSHNKRNASYSLYQSCVLWLVSWYYHVIWITNFSRFLLDYEIMVKSDWSDIIMCNRSPPGLSQSTSDDFMVRKDVIAHTRLDPRDRIRAIKDFISNVKGCSAASDELRKWNLCIGERKHSTLNSTIHFTIHSTIHSSFHNI